MKDGEDVTEPASKSSPRDILGEVQARDSYTKLTFTTSTGIIPSFYPCNLLMRRYGADRRYHGDRYSVSMTIENHSDVLDLSIDLWFD